jgi:uncharacterized membrane protein YphA (DoxX/SURF4 family)
MDRKAAQEVKRGPAPSGRAAWLGLAARLILAGVFIVSGSSKRAAPPEEFAVVIESYDIVPTDAARGIAAILPWVELLVGFSLLFGYFTPQASLAAGAMFLAFVVALLSTKVRGINLPNCGCFGGRFHPSPMTTAAMDSVLAVLSYVSLRHGGKRLSLDNWSA